MVLDEGFDTFQVINPPIDADSFRYDNARLARKILSFTKDVIDRDHERSIVSASSYKYGGGLKNWPLNEPLCNEIANDSADIGYEDYSDIMAVAPNRAQMRSVIIIAHRK